MSKEIVISEPGTNSGILNNKAAEEEVDFSEVYKKMTTSLKRQETTSKYQNSLPAHSSSFTP
jgi:hypothetical protein